MRSQTTKWKPWNIVKILKMQVFPRQFEINKNIKLFSFIFENGIFCDHIPYIHKFSNYTIVIFKIFTICKRNLTASVVKSVIWLKYIQWLWFHILETFHWWNQSEFQNCLKKPWKCKTFNIWNTCQWHWEALPLQVTISPQMKCLCWP